MGTILAFLFSGKGLLRGISALLAALSLLPGLGNYAEMLLEVSAIVGAGGITRAALRAAFKSFLDALK